MADNGTVLLTHKHIGTQAVRLSLTGVKGLMEGLNKLFMSMYLRPWISKHAWAKFNFGQLVKVQAQELRTPNQWGNLSHIHNGTHRLPHIWPFIFTPTSAQNPCFYQKLSPKVLFFFTLTKIWKFFSQRQGRSQWGGGRAGRADCPPGHQKSGRRAKIGKGKKGERKEKRGKGREKGRKKREREKEREKEKGKKKRKRKGKEKRREERGKGGEEKGEEREEKRKKMLNGVYVRTPKFIRDIEGVPVCKLPPTFTESFRPRPKLKNIADLYETLINIMFHRYLNISNGMNFA